MGFRCGIVGLPNVGKSTLFNALSGAAAADAANYPFCTIEPNVGRVPVPDPRLDRLADISGSAVRTPAVIDFVDIAGLVKGASQGEGLGNRFLARIREVDAIVHVLRCFDDDRVTHVTGRPDPVADAEVVETELLLADLGTLERARDRLIKSARSGDRSSRQQLEIVERGIQQLGDGQPARELADESNAALFRELGLLTNKPVLFVANVTESDVHHGNVLTQAAAAHAAARDADLLLVSAQLEAELVELEAAEDRNAFLASVGLSESGLLRVARAGYALLGLITFFTANPKEARAWTISAGTVAASAAGVIHSDFERGFIAAETAAFDTFVEAGGEQGARAAGQLRSEGRDYIVRDGDVILFRFNV